MKIFYIADTHFSHERIIKPDNRPFKSVEEMDNFLIEKWNSRVTKRDAVYIAGDFCWGTRKDVIKLLRRLNGNKTLILGNHDKAIRSSYNMPLNEVTHYKEVKDNGRIVCISHYPNLLFRAHRRENGYHLYGHVHNTKEYEVVKKWTQELKDNVEIQSKGQCFNIGVMMPWMNYAPRTLDEILEGVGKV